MKTTKGQKQSVTYFQAFAERLADKLPTKTKPFFLSLLLGALLAVAKRRTVTTWLQAAQISEDFRQAVFQQALYHMPNIGRKSDILFDMMLDEVLKKLGAVINSATFIRIVIDDSPTKHYGKTIEIIVDGGYAKDTVLLPLQKMEEVVTITRLRRDAALFEVPPSRKKGQRGATKKYGDRIDVKAKVASKHGWPKKAYSVECRQYGQVVRKKVKSFVASTKLTKGKPVKAVIVKEDEKNWVPLISTDATMEVKEILESYGVRFGIEEVFKDLKEVWGWGKQELRLLESSEAATTLNMLLYDMTELSAWDWSAEELVDRRHRPWDDADWRPSHEDRRHFLRHGILANEFNAVLGLELMPKKIIDILERLLKLAA